MNKQINYQLYFVLFILICGTIACSTNFDAFHSEDGSLSFSQFNNRIIKQDTEVQLKGTRVGLINVELIDDLIIASVEVQNINSKPFNVYDTINAQYETYNSNGNPESNSSVVLEKIFESKDCPGRSDHNVKLSPGESQKTKICWRNLRFVKNQSVAPKDINVDDIIIGYYNQQDNVGADFGMRSRSFSIF